MVSAAIVEFVVKTRKKQLSKLPNFGYLKRAISGYSKP